MDPSSHAEDEPNVRVSKGQMRFDNGAIYEGQWMNGKKDGRGILIWANSAWRYEGMFKNDMKHGIGILIFANGD